MYEVIKGIHNILRWVVVLGGVYALVQVYAGLLSRSAWTEGARRAGLVFTTTLDLQFLAGLILYGVSPLTRAAMRDMGAAMGSSDLRFFAVEHTLLMLLAVVAAHVGSVLARRAQTDRAKYLRAAIGFTVSAVLIAVAVPWWRPLLPTYW